MTRSDRVGTLEEAKAQFQKSWDAWKAWAKLEEVDLRDRRPRKYCCCRGIATLEIWQRLCLGSFNDLISRMPKR
jgi:hypothetical protein